MKLVELSVNGFGPLAAQKFIFADGMNVLYGPNESAKTTVHAAIFAGLCGTRRGQGQPEREDRSFEERHRPWDGGSWEVSTLLELADGRRIRITRDLASKVGSKAVNDADGVDVSSEIQFEGSIDGSVWLGLNRRSFRSTACVRQSEIVAALADDDDHKRDHSALQQALQRAATTAGQRDETAATALKSLNEFWRENVGLDDARSARRPYRRWKAKVERRKQILHEAEVAREQYLQLLAERDGAVAEREKRERAVKLAEAVVKCAKADALEAKAARADELQAKHPAAPGGTSSDQTLADQVMHALTLWDNAPPAPSLSGKSSDELEEELASLPERPTGELTPAQEVLDAASDLTAARKMLHQHGEARPSETVSLATSEAKAPHAVEPAVRAWSRARIPMVAVACFALIGLVAVALGAVALGAALLIAALATAGASFWFLRPTPTRAETAPAPVDTTGRRDPFQIWTNQHNDLQRAVEDSEGALVQALGRHNIAPSAGEPTHAAFERYKADCAGREEQDRRARRRDQIKLALQQREKAEEQYAAREDAIAALREVASSAGLGEADPAEIAARLRAWQDQRGQDLGAHDEAQREWAELEQLLAERTLGALWEVAREARAAAGKACDGFSPTDLETVDARVAESELPRLRHELREAAEFAAGRSQLTDSEARKLKSVAEAEAELELTQEGFARIAELGQTLQTTIGFLEEAQRRVYESIAPALMKTLKDWLPRVTVYSNGAVAKARYNDVHVDPQTLAVRVRLDTGPWRNVDLLSAGTKEQIYLLLRVALTDHLVKDGETIPLLLDEVTAQCDSSRRKAILDLLFELGDERQVILFTHEDAVFEWATANLPTGAVQTLSPIG